MTKTKRMLKVIGSNRSDRVKEKTFQMIEVDGGFTPRDVTFPVGESQIFTSDDVQEVGK